MTRTAAMRFRVSHDGPPPAPARFRVDPCLGPALGLPPERYPGPAEIVSLMPPAAVPGERAGRL